MSEQNYDVIVIGAGPGGYIAAERAGQAGKKALLIEKEDLGGVCLNWGCIPTKTLLASSKLFYQAQHGESFGVDTENVTFNLERAMQRKAQIQDGLRKGIAGLMKKYKVDVVKGSAQIVSRGVVAVDGTEYQGDNILICTGSRPAMPPIPGADQDHVLDSSGILDIDTLPHKLAIIGGGVIGLEFACFFAQVGVPVTVIEMQPEVAGATEASIAKSLRQTLEKKGVTFHLKSAVTAIGKNDVTVKDPDGESFAVEADVVLMSVGRIPNPEGIGLEAVGIDTHGRKIVIDEQCRTNVPGIYAAGDVTAKIQLAHTASRQGEVAINTMFADVKDGSTDRMRYHAIPSVIYTSPEVASVGLSEAQAKADGIPVKASSFPMQANGRFLAEYEGKGMCTVVIHAETRQLLGVHMIGAACSEMIAGAAIMIEQETRVDEVKEIVFPHPTVSETIRDAVFHF